MVSKYGSGVLPRPLAVSSNITKKVKGKGELDPQRLLLGAVSMEDIQSRMIQI